MASLLWNDVVEIPREEALSQLLTILDEEGLTATSWQEGAVAPVLVNIGADVREKISQIAVFLRDAFNLETATGETLTHTLKGFYDLTRNAALESQHLVTLECEVGEGPHIIPLGDLVISHPDGHSFRNVEGNAITYPYTLTSGNSVTLLFESEIAGASSNIGPGSGGAEGTVTLQMVTTLSGVSIEEHEIERDGTDDESDPRAKERAHGQWSLLTQFEVIDDAVKAIAMASSAAITRVGVDSTNPRGPFTFDVYIGGTDATASDLDLGAAQFALENRVRGGASVVRALKATEVEVDLVGTVYFSSLETALNVQTAVEAALLAFIRGAPLGGYSYPPGPSNVLALNDIESVIRSATVNGANPVRTVILTTPAANIAIPVYGLPVRGDWSGLTYTSTTG